MHTSMVCVNFPWSRFTELSLVRINTDLAGKYTIFGHVIDGLHVLDKMEKVPVGAYL